MDPSLASFGRRNKTADPLLFDADDKDTLDCLLGPGDRSGGSAFGGITDLDFEGLDPLSSSDLNNWLQNSSLSQLTTALDTDHENSLSDGNLLPMNPENMMPLQQQQTSHMAHGVDSDLDNANNAAMRLHANCSDVEVEGIQTVLVQQKPGTQTTQHIQLVAVPVTVSSGSNTPINSPMKAGSTIILDSNTFSQLTGATYIASPQKLQTVTTGHKTRSVLTPSQCSPVLVGHLQSGIGTQRPISVTVASPIKHSSILHVDTQQTVVTAVHSHHHRSLKGEEKVYPKPVFSYSCLIALALKNSKTGNLPVSEIYNFMCENFPYFKTAPDGWKNSVRHNLSLNKCFAKVDNPKLSSGAKKGCLWALNPAKVAKMEEEICKWGKKDPVTLLSSMAYPENLEAIEKGLAGLPFRKESDSDEDENNPSPASPHTPLTPLKKELPSTPQKCIEDHTSDYAESPLRSFDIDQEYITHANMWNLQAVTEDDLQMEHLLSNSALTSSPIATIAHTPSRSVQLLGMSQIMNSNYLSSPSRLQQVNSPSAVRINLFGITPTRTLSAHN